MTEEPNPPKLDGPPRDLAPTETLRAIRAAARSMTPARLFLDGPGTSYSTADLLKLRADHAAARDAVNAALDIDHPAFAPLVDSHGLFAVRSRASSHREYLAKPHLGRQLDDASRELVRVRCVGGVDLQVVLGDGLSPRAVASHGPEVFEHLVDHAHRHGWSTGQPFFVSRCRVGIMNDVGDLVRPTIVVLLIGERPGLATVDSMSAYLGYRPRTGHTDADRNLVCNIHEHGIHREEAGARVFELATRLRTHGASGFGIKEL
jgi:ethanolamine ammonia-lyase small subunit